MRQLDELRLATRRLRHSPLFAVSVILTLALTIGANATIFSFVNALLFQPLPVQKPGRIVRLVAHTPLSGISSPFPWSYPDFNDYRNATRSVFNEASLFAPQGFNLLRQGEVRNVHSAVVSGSFFQAMGLHPLLGRTFDSGAGAQAGAAPQVVISEVYWRREFGSDPAIIGRTIVLNKQPFTIIGVVKGGSVFRALGSPRLFVPVHAAMRIMSGNSLSARGARWIQAVYARLRPGVSPADAQKVVDFESSRLAKQYPKSVGKFDFQMSAAKTSTYADLLLHNRTVTVRVTELLWLAVILILLIACANILNLFLARGSNRLREMVIRSVLGASRWTLVRQLLMESGLLCAAGGLAGSLLAFAALAYARSFPAIAQLRPAPDPRVWGYTAALTVGAALLFGLAPMTASMRRNLAKYLNVIRPTPSRRQQRQRRFLIIGQIALSMALLVATGLILHTLISLQNVDLGFNPNRLLVAELDFSGVTGKGFKPPPGTTLRQLREKLASLPGVKAVSFADKTPLDGISMGVYIAVPGFTPPAGVEPTANLATIGPGYFHTLGAQMLRGSGFTAISANSSNAVIVNQAMAREYWPGENPVGRSFTAGQTTLRVAGVVADIRESNPATTPRPFYYLRYPHGAGAFIEVLVRTARSPTAGLRQTIARTISTTVPGLPAFQVNSMHARLQGMLASRTRILWALGVFGLIALAITAVGIFSVVAYNLTLRYPEFAMRMALGARPGDIRRLVLGQILRFAGIGILAGFLLSLLASHLLKHYLFGISFLDPASFLVVIGLLLAVALAAGALPVWRASRLQPSRILHEQ